MQQATKANHILGNDLKKGDIVLLDSGMTAKITSNKKGNIKEIFAYGSAVGLYDEFGSCYIWNIVGKVETGEKLGRVVTPIQLTDKQKASRTSAGIFG